MVRRLFFILFVATLTYGCKSPEARRPVQSHSGSFIKESAQRNKKIYEEEKSYIEKIIVADSTEDYIASNLGFWYYYNKRDTTNAAMPKVGDVISFTYNIKDLNGETIVSEKENGMQHYRVDKSNQELISGVREGIKLMREGEIVTFLFPSYKAFGYYGIEEKLGTNIPIQSTVTLHSIEKTKEHSKDKTSQ